MSGNGDKQELNKKGTYRDEREAMLLSPLLLRQSSTVHAHQLQSSHAAVFAEVNAILHPLSMPNLTAPSPSGGHSSVVPPAPLAGKLSFPSPYISSGLSDLPLRVPLGAKARSRRSNAFSLSNRDQDLSIGRRRPPKGVPKVAQVSVLVR
jgi:hypothetical protein